MKLSENKMGSYLLSVRQNELLNKKFEYFAILVLGLFPLYPYALSAILIATVLVLNIVLNGIKYSVIWEFSYYLLFLFFISFAFSGVGITLNKLSSSYLLILFPIAFSSFKLTIKHVKLISTIYLIGIGLKSLLLIYFFYTQNTYNIHTAELPFLSLDYHAAYFFYEVLMGVFLLLFISKTNVKYLILIYFTFVIFMLQSRIGYLVFGINLLFLIFTDKKKYIIPVAGFLTLLFITLSSYLFKTNNIIETYSNFSLTHADTERINLIKAGYENFLESPLFGKGAIYHRDFIERYFGEINELSYLVDYNSHNYFIFVLASGGILGLFLFIAPYFKIFFKYGFNLKAPIIPFMISTLLLCSTENIFSRYNGVVVFCFFSYFFYQYPRSSIKLE